MIYQTLSPQLNRGAARTAEIRDAFIRAHAQYARVRNGRHLVLEEFTVGRIANDAQLEIMKSHTIELLMQFMALPGCVCPSWRALMAEHCGVGGVSAELGEHVEEAHALAVQAQSDRRAEFCGAAPRTSGKMVGDQPSGCRQRCRGGFRV
jgi:hypothetical protein